MRHNEAKVARAAFDNQGEPSDSSDVILRIARAAEAEGLDLCLWRHASVMEELGGSDVDAFIRPQPWSRVQAFLDRELEGVGWLAHRYVRRGNMMFCMLSRRDARPGNARDYLKLDLNSAVSIHGVPFASMAELIGRSRVVDGMRLIEPVDAMVTSFLVKYLDHGNPKPGYVEGFWAAYREEPDRVGRLVNGAVGRGLANRLLTRGAARPRQVLLTLARYRQALLLRPLETAATFFRKLCDFVPVYLRPPGRMLILSGPDGAGKSTTIDLVTKMTAERIFVGVRYFHTRPFLIPRLAKVIPMSAARRRALLAPPPRADILRDPGIGSFPSTSLPKSMLRLVILILDFSLGYWIKVRPRLCRGELVIFDRYIQDYIIDARKRGIAMPRGVFRFLAGIIPKGDLYVYMVAKPETLIARKGELLPDEAAEQVRNYRTLASESGSGLLIDTDHVDAKQAAAQVFRRLLAMR